MSDAALHGRLSRAALVIGGLVGALGIVTAAAASHGQDARLLGAASSICLAHGPVLVALGLFGLRTRVLTAAAVLLVLGTVVFAGDLLARQLMGGALFPLAAPLGGLAMIGGWVALAIAGIITKD
jgi:uncharacterized membrane protein YgdD (TMEM256/DUF423 family)